MHQELATIQSDKQKSATFPRIATTRWSLGTNSWPSLDLSMFDVKLNFRFASGNASFCYSLDSWHKIGSLNTETFG